MNRRGFLRMLGLVPAVLPLLPALAARATSADRVGAAWQAWQSHTIADPLFSGELGTWEGVRWIETRFETRRRGLWERARQRYAEWLEDAA